MQTIECLSVKDKFLTVAFIEITLLELNNDARPTTFYRNAIKDFLTQ